MGSVGCPGIGQEVRFFQPIWEKIELTLIEDTSTEKYKITINTLKFGSRHHEENKI